MDFQLKSIDINFYRIYFNFYKNRNIKIQNINYIIITFSLLTLYKIHLNYLSHWFFKLNSYRHIQNLYNITSLVTLNFISNYKFLDSKVFKQLKRNILFKDKLFLGNPLDSSRDFPNINLKNLKKLNVFYNIFYINFFSLNYKHLNWLFFVRLLIYFYSLNIFKLLPRI
jgi:hypothetical protein